MRLSLKELSDVIFKEISIDKDDLILDIGANDGTLLNFSKGNLRESDVNLLKIYKINFLIIVNIP